ncbi:MAG: cysteine desulfurase, partial [Planctomycetota bacterium]|nr:cysteine desulfurase [Planctomycetota bacterium]
VHTLSQKATDAYERARVRTMDFLGAGRPEEIIFVRGATEGINLVSQAYLRPRIEPGDEIVISTLEHHSNIVPWQLLREQAGAVLKVAPIDDDGAVDIQAYQDLLSDRTKFVSLVHVSNALGTINPIREMVAMAREKEIPVLVDGAQAAAHSQVDVGKLGCDFYTISGHKMYGPTGIGALYGKAQLLEEMPPYHGGGEMILSVTFDKTEYNRIPYKFEAGTPDIAGAIGLGAAIEYIEEAGLESIEAHEKNLLDYATAAASSIDGVEIIGQAPAKAGILSFIIDGVHPHDAGTILDQQGVAVRAGHHCAQPVLERLGVQATVRASFALYNTREEVDLLTHGITKAVEVFA